MYKRSFLPRERVYRREEFTQNDIDRIVSGGGPNAQNGGPAGGNPPPGGAAPGAGSNPPPGGNPAPGAGGGNPPPGGNNPPPGGNGTPPGADQPLNYDLRQLGFKDQDEFLGKLNTYKTLEKDLAEAKAQPRFKSDRAKFMYDFANGFEGMEADRAMQLLSLVSTPVEKMADHQARLEQFKLRPENKGFTQDEVMLLFAEHENREFGAEKDSADPANANYNKTRELKLRQASSIAKGELQKVMDDWNKTRPVEPSPEQLLQERQEYERDLQNQLSTAKFEGLEIPVSALGEDGKTLVESKVNYKIEAAQLKEVVSALSDPQGMWVKLLSDNGVMSADGKINQVAFAKLVSQIKFMPQIMNSVYAQARADFQKNLLNQRRNPGDGNVFGNGGAPAGNGNNANKSEQQLAGEAALKTVGG